MSDETEKNEPDSLENPEKVVDEIVARLSSLQGSLIDSATQVGYARDSIQASRPMWAKLSSLSINDPYKRQIYISGVKVLCAYRDELQAHESQAFPFFEALRNTITAGSPGFATGTTAGLVANEDFDLPPYAFPPLTHHEDYAERLSKLDPALGKTYQEIWEVLYGTRADPERGALYLIRQSFDHLFDLLAPDDEVRKSNFWRHKSGGKKSQVTREERILYAANKHIKNSARAKTLSESAKHMGDVYQDLNRVHERGELNKQQALKALAEMKGILEEWVDALET